MSKRKNVVITAVILAGVMVLILIVAAIYKHFAPSSARKDLNTIFELGKDEVALIEDGEVLKQKGLKLNGKVYVPADVAADMDERIFVDTKEKHLLYADAGAGELLQAEPEALDYHLGKEKKNMEAAILSEQNGGLYVLLDFIGERASCYYKTYDNPSRLVIMSSRTASYVFATLDGDTRVRTGPGKKYEWITEVAEGGKVIVDNMKPEENEYQPVKTMDGISGYIPKDSIAGTEETLWKFEKEPSSFEQKGMKETVCLAWHQTSDEYAGAVLPSVASQGTPMNVISPTWFALSDAKGNFASKASPEYVSRAHAAGLKVWGLVNDFNQGKKLKKILGKTSSRSKLVNGLVGAAIQCDLDGINVDFEKVTKKSARGYLEFLRELVLKCHANGLVVSVDNYPPENYNAYYNLEEQGRVVDYVVLMAYDEHYGGSEESGSVSSLNYVKKGVRNMTAKVPKERVIVGLPFYTRLWKEVKNKKKPESQSYGMSNAESVLRANGAAAEWDEKTGQYYATWKSGGAVYKIWLEEEKSLKAKLKEVRKAEVAGAAFWKIGFERNITWDTIAQSLKK